MCGIAGNCNFAGKRVERSNIERMIKTLVHRGPDDAGIYISADNNPDSPAQVGLGHRRLSIIDLKTGHQPMSNEDDSIWIVFNGEIYNFLELRERLLSKGHRFKTKSDTEVILHLYEDQDLECVRLLRGMFAFAIWDNKKKRLFLARDRVGKKPLVYYQDSKNLIFASEIKAILENGIKREVNLGSIDYFLSYGYVPSPQSILKGIKKLPPGHILTYDSQGLAIQRYWRISYQKQKITFAESKQRLKEILTESVRLRLISDVPLGVFLSGGIDSSIVVALMSKLCGSGVKTFSIGFEEEDYSELKFARKVAERYNTEHREFVVKPDAFEILNKLVWHYNEPFGDSSCVPSYYLAKMTREFVPVALNGDGGDESFVGYERYRGMQIARYLKYLPKPLIKVMLSLLKTKSRHIDVFLKGLLNYTDEWRRYGSWVGCFQEEDKQGLYSDCFKASLGGDVAAYLLNLAEQSHLPSPAERAMEVDINSYLPEDLLVKMDIATMANSLEARSPFLDHNVMEFAASLPIGFKMRSFKLKYLLKELAQDLLPKEILQRRKMGFAVPVDKWFRTNLKQFAYDTLLDKKSIERGYFRKERIKALLDEHCSGRFNHGARIWSLLNLEVWHKIFIDTATSH
ncbi:MAG: asparagine synthase (glutamine-hydrolyzing) [Omnitrophica bacterium]|nr:asparagine synthase (glutamine-hydrolyzing) [Candidatus Omnitrophota bacterium]